MAIPGQANIHIGAENQVAGSDNLRDAFLTIQNNFTTLFNTSSTLSTFRAGDGVTISANASNGVVDINNTGVTKITAGSGVAVSGANGNVTISVIPQGPAGVTRVGITSSSLNIGGVTGNIVSAGTFTVDLPRLPTGANFATGTYIAPNITVDAYGRITAVVNGAGVGTVTSVGLTPGNGIAISGGPITDSGSITVENTGVTKLQAGSGITLSGSNGEITIGATNLSSGTVSYVGITSNSLTVTGGAVTSNGNINLEVSANLLANLYHDSNATALLANYLPNYLPNYSGNFASNNITAGNLNATGNVHANIVSANTFVGSFSGNATTAATVTTNAQPNITSVGTLSSVATSGNANVGTSLNVTGNANITGNLSTFIATANYAIVQSGLTIGPSGYVLLNTTNNLGTYVALLPPSSVSQSIAWALPSTIGNLSTVLVSNGGQMEWRVPPAAGVNLQVQFNDANTLGGNANLTFNKTTGLLSSQALAVTANANVGNLGTSGTVTASRFISNIATGTSPFAVTSTTMVTNLFSNYANTIIANAQPNITSVGTLTSLTVSSNIKTPDIIASNAIVASNTSALLMYTVNDNNTKFVGLQAPSTVASSMAWVLPNTLGTSNQVLTTDGSGTMRWATPSAGAGFDGANVVTISNVTVSTNTTTGALKVSGGVGIDGNINVGGLKHVINGNIHITGVDSKTLYIGSYADATTFTAPTLIMKNAYSTYVQAGLINSSQYGSADWVAYADNGDDTQGWADMGMTSSNFSDINYTITGKNDGYFFVKATAGAAQGGNLVIATSNTGTTNDIVFGMGGFYSDNIFARMSRANSALEIPAGDINLGSGNLTLSRYGMLGAKNLTITNGANIQGDVHFNGFSDVTFGGNIAGDVSFRNGNVSFNGNITSNVNLNGTLFLGANASLNSAGYISSKSIDVSGTVSASGNIVSQMFVEGQYLKADSTIYAWGGGAATSTTTGDLRLAGGAGIGGNIYAGGIVKTGVFTSSTIPTASDAGAGARAFVTDAIFVNYGSSYTGGGSNAAPVWSNGTGWFVG